MQMVKRNLYTVITFCVAVIMTLIVYIYIGIAPFGDNTLMIWDMQWQYSSFFSWFHELLWGNVDWKYSFIGFGGNTMGLISYYLTSPLNIILLFFNKETMNYGVMILMLLKTGCMASSLQWYLWQKRADVYSVLFGCMYALSSYVICNQPNIMWMDALILLPLIVYGIEKVVDEGRGLIYGITLGVAIFSNYYIGYMLCLFAVIYFFLYLVIYRKKTGVSYLVRRCLNFGWYSLLAGGMTMFLLLPTLWGLQHSGNKHLVSLRSLISLKPLYHAGTGIYYTYAGTFDGEQGILGEYPLIYCGVLCVFLIVLFLIGNASDRREKLFKGILLLVLGAACVFEGPYLIFHGCYYPDGSPWRHSFLLCFAMLLTAYSGLGELKKENTKLLWIGNGIVLVYSVYICVRYGNLVNIGYNVLTAVVLEAIYLCKGAGTDRRKGNGCLLALAIVVLGAELIYNSIVIHQVQYTGKYESNAVYQLKNDAIEELLEKINADGTELYRVETINGAERNQNDGYLFQMNTVEMYSSSETKEKWDVFTNMGWGRPGQHVVYEDDVTGFSRNLAGVKYIFDSEDRSDLYELIGEKGNIKLYKNPAAMPLGFLVKASAAEITGWGTENLFEFQNRLFQNLLGSTGEEIYRVVDLPIEEEYTDIKDKIVRQPDGTYTDGILVCEEDTDLMLQCMEECREHTMSVRRIDDGVIEAQFDNPVDETAYACFSIPYEDNWKASVDGEDVSPVLGMGGFLLVPVSEGTHTVVLEYEIPYFGLGIVISIISVLLLVMSGWIEHKYVNKCAKQIAGIDQ